jgi:hypothetical protein
MSVGYFDCGATVTKVDSTDHDVCLTKKRCDGITGFFVTEGISLKQNVPQALFERDH